MHSTINQNNICPIRTWQKQPKECTFAVSKNSTLLKKNRYIYLPELSLPKLPENLNCEYHNR
jgi:hypothetical protein